MKCDFCGEEHHYTEMLGFPQNLVEPLASLGFVPTGFITLVRKIAPHRDAETYFREVVSRYGQNDEWGLCIHCRTEMQHFAQKIIGMR